MFHLKRGRRDRILRRGLGVGAALVLATLVLAGLSIQAVYREAQVRKRLIADTHRGIADLVTARLDAGMEEADRIVTDEMASIEANPPAILTKLREIEDKHPELRPLVLVLTEPADTANSRVPLPGRISDLLAAAG